MKQKILLFITAATAAAAAALALAACETVYEDRLYDVYVRSEDAIAIADAEGLARIGVDEGCPLDGEYYLAEDIDLSPFFTGWGGVWTPVGPAAAPFAGILDGNGKTVRGLKLEGGTGAWSGLFGYMLHARLFDLTIETNGMVTVMTSAAAQYAGIAAGYAKSSYIENVTIRGTADAVVHMIKVLNAAFYAGALAGRLDGSTARAITVNLNLKAVSGGALYAGLVAGESAGGPLLSCSAAGSVNAAAAATGMYAGGIAGQHNNVIENCVSAVTGVYAESSAAIPVYAGGIAGNTAAASGSDSVTVGFVLSSSLLAGHPVTIKSKSAGTVYAGGISGFCALTAGLAIDRCLVDAPELAITAESSGTSFSSSAQGIYAGGIAGYSNTVRRSVIRRGEVLAKATATGTVTTLTLAAGGVSGLVVSGSTPTIERCFSGANVTVDSSLQAVDGAGNKITAAGGVAGILQSATNIADSAATGAVRVISTSGETGTVFAGGIAGFGSFLSSTAISIKQSAALNREVTAEAVTATPHAWRVLGGSITAQNNWTVPGPDAVPGITSIDLYRNYALPSVAVKTGQVGGELEEVPQGMNNAANLMGSATLQLTQQSFQELLEWNFDTDWYWDAEANLPFPRQ